MNSSLYPCSVCHLEFNSKLELNQHLNDFGHRTVSSSMSQQKIIFFNLFNLNDCLQVKKTSSGALIKKPPRASGSSPLILPSDVPALVSSFGSLSVGR